MTDDERKIEVNHRLLTDNIISKEMYRKLRVRNNRIWDDSDWPVDVCDNGDVYIHQPLNAYPEILRGYATPYQE